MIATMQALGLSVNEGKGVWRVSLQATAGEYSNEYELGSSCDLDALEEWHRRDQQHEIIQNVDARKSIVLY